MTQMAAPESFIDIATAQRLADVYAQMAQREPILDATVQALNLQGSWENLRGRILVVHPPGSLTIEIRATDLDPRRARDLAAGVAQQLIETSPTAVNRKEIEERRRFVEKELESLQAKIQAATAQLEKERAALDRERSARVVLERQDEIKALELNISNWRTTYASLLAAQDGSPGPNTLSVIEAASLPSQPISSRSPWIVLLAAMVGFSLAAGGILAIEHLEDTVKTKDDLGKLLAVPVLGTIPRIALPRTGAMQVAVMSDLEAPGVEGYRVFAANLRFAMLARSAKLLLVTSAADREGKSTTAANLAAALALGGREVLLVDLDLINPSLHTMFGVRNDVGVTSLIADPDRPLADYAVETAIPQLKLLASGPLPPNSAELLSRFGEPLLGRLRGVADYVIVDAPPLLAVADTPILAALVDGVVMVGCSGRTPRGRCRAAAEALERVNGRLIGALLNAAPRRELGLYDYRHGHKRRGLLGRLFPSGRKGAAQVSPSTPLPAASDSA
jgi:capsular exopolysaccharide synthesis family protein